MKVLPIVFCATIVYVVGVYSDNAHADHEVEKAKDKLNGHDEECASEKGVDLKVMFHEMRTNKNFSPTQEMHCFAACLFKKSGLMNPDGSLTRKHTDSEGAQICKNISGRDECDAAYKIMECLDKHDFLITE